MKKMSAFLLALIVSLFVAGPAVAGDDHGCKTDADCEQGEHCDHGHCSGGH